MYSLKTDITDILMGETIIFPNEIIKKILNEFWYCGSLNNLCNDFVVYEVIVKKNICSGKY